MPVTVTYIGGPRHKNKNTLKNKDQHPETIAVPDDECKAANMRPGHYVISGKEAKVQPYIWRAE